MNRFCKALVVSALTVTLTGGMSFAQDHHDDRDHPHDAPGDRGPDHGPDRDRGHDRDHRSFVRHQEWRKGYHMRDEDWRRGERVDYRAYHLRRPPAGYEWREVDGNYVMAAVATGIIASVIIASAAH
jgi:Ni/Co efflux regulator RcnB